MSRPLVDLRKSKAYFYYAGCVHIIDENQATLEIQKDSPILDEKTSTNVPASLRNKNETQIKILLAHNEFIIVPAKDYFDQNTSASRTDNLEVLAAKLELLIQDTANLTAFTTEQQKILRQKVPEFIYAMEENYICETKKNREERIKETKIIYYGLYKAIKAPTSDTVKELTLSSNKFKSEHSLAKGIFIFLLGVVCFAAGLLAAPLTVGWSLSGAGVGIGVMAYGFFRIAKSPPANNLKTIEKTLHKNLTPSK